MSALERELRERLRQVDPPDRREAQERAWNLVRAGFDEREPPRRASRTRRRALQAVLAAALVVLVISPAGAAVRSWVGDAVSPGREPSRPALTSLPSDGSLLVQTSAGPWVVRPDGSKRLLGGYGGSAWSPRGLYVAAASRHELSAIEPDGTVRWRLDREGPVRLPSWNGPDGFRIAYLDGAALRVVDGNGSGDHLVRASAAAVAPAWKPGPRYLVSFAKPDGAVETVAADTRRKVFSTAPGAMPIGMQWSRDGSALLVVRPAGVELLDPAGHATWRRPAPPGARIVAARLSPHRPDRVATIVSGGGRSRALIAGPGIGNRALFAGPGRFSDLEWSPDERWILLAWRSADQWLFLSPSGSGRIDAVSNISRQFSSGAPAKALPFPTVQAWCCQAERRPQPGE